MSRDPDIREWRCLKCSALLARYGDLNTFEHFGFFEVKCRRCHALNQLEFCNAEELKKTCLIA